MSCALLYRGLKTFHFDTTTAINQVRSEKNIRFVDWIPTAIKVGINNSPTLHLPKSGI